MFCFKPDYAAWQVRDRGAARATTRAAGVLYEAASWADIEALLFPGAGVGDAPPSTGTCRTCLDIQ